MTLACSTVVLRHEILADALRVVRDAGFDWVEVQATIPFCSHVDLDRDDPAEFRLEVDRLGFRGVTSIWTHHGALIPDPLSVSYAERCLSWAARAGIPVVNIGDGFMPAGMHEDQAFRVLEERLKAVVEAAEREGVTVAIEPHGTFSLTEEGLGRILSVSPSRRLGVNYDPANIYRAAYVESSGGHFQWKGHAEGGDEVQVLRSVVDRVVHFHVKDVRDGACVPLGQGTVNLSGCLAVLDEAGYQGVVSLETEGSDTREHGERLIRESRAWILREHGGLFGHRGAGGSP